MNPMAKDSEEHDLLADANFPGFIFPKSIVFRSNFRQTRPFSWLCIPSAEALGVIAGVIHMMTNNT